MVVDGCQGVVHMPVDVAALGCDFYVSRRINSMDRMVLGVVGPGRHSGRDAPYGRR